MKTVHKSVLIWYSAREMFDLVADVEKYPQFLPWCDRARVIEADAAGMKAEVGIAFSGLRQSFTTRNDHDAPDSIRMRLVSGPFSSLEGEWRFSPVAENRQDERACRVELQLQYGFDNFALSALVGPVFDKIAASMVDAFVKRAEQVYG
jgi:ribosome-associated toxin RatA of RatAB toxin-antitoxin module